MVSELDEVFLMIRICSPTAEDVIAPKVAPPATGAMCSAEA